jgi:ornithine cyclodeaminase/alanine dehydrogenase-like protein (mu-crystallin family)
VKLRILTEGDCRALLGMRDAIDLQAEAFSLLASGAVLEGLRAVAKSENPPGVAIFNPCFLREGRGFGIKVVSDFYANSARGLPRMSALIALFAGETGLPRTLLEGGYITDLRTGAGTALAARHLARPDSRTLGVVGAGRVARNQIEALSTVFKLDTVKVYARTPERAKGMKVELVSSPEQAVRGADLVVAATTSSQPVIRGEWLAPGAFVAAVGAFAPDMRELDDTVIRRAACHVIDSRSDVLERAGDFLAPIAKGVLRRDQIAEIAEIVSGKRSGRRSREEIAVYKSSGVPIQDLVTAREVERRAIAQGAGTVLELGGDHD